MKLVLSLIVIGALAVAVSGQAIGWGGQWDNTNTGPYNVGGYFNVCLTANNIPDTPSIYPAYGFFGTFGVTSGTVNATSGIYTGTFQVAGVSTPTYPTTGVFWLQTVSPSSSDSDQRVGFNGWYSYANNPTVQNSWSGRLLLNSSAMTGGLGACFAISPQAISNTIQGDYVEVAVSASGRAQFDVCLTTDSTGVSIFEASYASNNGGYMYGTTQNSNRAMFGNWADGSGQGYLIGRVFDEQTLIIYRTPELKANSNNLYTVVSRNSTGILTTANCHRNFNRINQLVPNPPPVPNINAGGLLLPSLFAVAVSVVIALFF